MSNRHCLGRLGNDELLADISVLVKRGDELLSDLLTHLAELDKRRLFLELGFPSLFAYCTVKLGMCESSAGRRILAARVCRKFPEAFAQVARGELSLSARCAMSPHLDCDNAAELATLCGRRSRRDIEQLLAARFPRPDVRESVRRLPAGTEGSAHPRLEALSAGRVGVHFTADLEFRDLLERARALASHRLPAGDMAEVIKLGLKAFIREAEKQRFGVGRKPRGKLEARVSRPAEMREMRETPQARPPGGCSEPSTLNRTRHISAAVAREVYARDQAQCSFMSADGRRCGCRSFLELGHVMPWAMGGASHALNLRLRCRAHNQEYARAQFGSGHIARAIAARRTLSPRSP